MTDRVVVLEGLTPYAAAHALQAALVDLRREEAVGDVVLLLQHPPTITLGRRKTAIDNVLDAEGVALVATERGGDATWHAPGQLVAYPIVALDGPRRDVHRHLHALEQAVIDVLAPLGLEGGRDDRNTGVWVEGRKVCSIGIAIRQWVSWHGLALNVDVDLAGFARINPCGFEASVMTRLADHLAPCPRVEDLVAPLGQALVRTVGLGDVAWARASLQDASEVPSLVAALRR